MSTPKPSPASIIGSAFNSMALVSSALSCYNTARIGMVFYSLDAPTSAFIMLASAVPQFFMAKWNFAHFRHANALGSAEAPEAFSAKRHMLFPAVRAAIPHLLLSGAIHLGLSTLPPEVKEKLEAQATQQQATQAQKPAASAPQ